MAFQATHICTGKSALIDEDPDAELLQKIKEIREEHKDYGYRRLWGELRKQGIKVNKKRVHRIVQKYGLQVTSYTRKSRRFSTYKGVVGRISPNGSK